MKKNGFTIVEILVAVGIFITLLSIVSGIFISSIYYQKRTLAAQRLLNQTSYALEYMSRFLRMAKKDLSGACLGIAKAKHNYDNPEGDKTRLRFLNYKNKCQEFFLAEGQLRERKSLDETAENFGDSLALTSEKFQVTSLSFKLAGQNQTDNLQPKATILLSIKDKGLTAPPRLTIQTTISQRNLDIEY